MSDSRPKVGAGIVVVNNGKILLAKRKGSHGAGMWGSAGGHVEFGEKPIDTVIREAKEELGIKLKDIEYLCTMSYVIEGKHYIDLGFKAKIRSGTPTIQPEEVNKIEEVKWFDLNKLPSPIFPPVKVYLKALKTGQVYFEMGE